MAANSQISSFGQPINRPWNLQLNRTFFLEKSYSSRQALISQHKLVDENILEEEIIREPEKIKTPNGIKVGYLSYFSGFNFEAV